MWMVALIAVLDEVEIGAVSRTEKLLGFLDRAGRDSPGLELPSRAGVGLLQRSIQEIDDLVNEVKRGLVKQDHEDVARAGCFWREPWLHQEQVAKLAFLRQLGAHEWDLGDLNPNRRKFLAQVGRRSTSQTLQRMPDRRRYPT